MTKAEVRRMCEELGVAIPLLQAFRDRGRGVV